MVETSDRGRSEVEISASFAAACRAASSTAPGNPGPDQGLRDFCARIDAGGGVDAGPRELADSVDGSTSVDASRFVVDSAVVAAASSAAASAAARLAAEASISASDRARLRSVTAPARASNCFAVTSRSAAMVSCAEANSSVRRATLRSNAAATAACSAALASMRRTGGESSRLVRRTRVATRETSRFARFAASAMRS